MNASEPQLASPPRIRRWFQFRLRTLLVVVLLVSIAMSWFASRLQRARKQKETVAAIRQLGGGVLYDHQFDNGTSLFDHRGPAWLRRVLEDDFFAKAVYVLVRDNVQLEYVERLAHVEYLQVLGPHSVTDAELEHLKGLTELRTLRIIGGQVTDAGLEHVMGLTQLQELGLISTRVTDEGVRELRHALPNCNIERR